MTIQAEIGVTPGLCMEAVALWVKCTGMPEPPAARWSGDEFHERVAAALDSHFWEQGKGFTYGCQRPRSWVLSKPWGKPYLRQPHMYLHFVDWYIEHGANLVSAYHGAMAYWLAWRITERESYREKVRHFLRALLQFTYLWQPKNKDLLYEPKPFYGTTGWHYMAWTDRCVIWHQLLCIDICHQLKFDWAEFDPELDWAT